MRRGGLPGPGGRGPPPRPLAPGALGQEGVLVVGSWSGGSLLVSANGENWRVIGGATYGAMSVAYGSGIFMTAQGSGVFTFP